MARVIYRNRKTGRFVKRATWKRSKAKKGTRYVRKSVRVRKHIRKKLVRKIPRRVLREPEEIEKFEEIELVGGFDSPGRKKK